MKFFTNVLRWLFGLGAFFHALFAMFAVFQPDQLAMLTSIGPIAFSYVWVAQAGMLMFVIGLLSIPVLYNPHKFRVYAWALAAGTLLEGLYWHYLSLPAKGGIFTPLARFWIALGVAELVIVLLLAETNVRMTLRNWRETFEEWRRARAEANPYMRWFGFILCIQLALGTFIIYCHLFNQNLLRFPVGEGVLFHSWEWIALSGIELIVAVLLLIPTACAPIRYWSFCWLAIINPLLVSWYWFCAARRPFHTAFIIYALVDFVTGVALFVVFQKGAPEDKRFSPENVQRFLSFLADTLALQGQPVLIRVVGVCVLVVGLSMTWVLWYYFLRQERDLQFGSEEMQYKYGAVGLSISARVPYYLFEALPDVFPEFLPEYPQPPGARPLTNSERFAKYIGVVIIPEDGAPTPVGYALREIGFKSVEPNCALCHVAQIRLPDGRTQIVYGAPNTTLNIQAYQWFILNAVVSPKFNVPTIMDAIDKRHDLGFLDRFFYRTAIIPAIRNLLLQSRYANVWQFAHGRPKWGRGRVDTFNTTKLGVMEMPDDGTVGTTDLPAVWQLGRRHDKKMWMHWDGNNASIPERNYTAAMAVGASPDSIIEPAFQGLVDYFWRLEPAAYPLPFDAAKAAAGKVLFVANCAGCHSWDANNVGKVTQSVDTDPNRAKTFTTEHCRDFKKITYPPFYFPNYRKLKDPMYVNPALDGLWTRAPYLHHGAVPTLWDLLQPAAARPKQFYRGYNVFDPVKFGFVSEGPEAAAVGTLYDTTALANCNSGHEYGTTLTPDQKYQLIEFFKTDDPLISGKGIPIPVKVDDAPIAPPEPCEEQSLVPPVVACNVR